MENKKKPSSNSRQFKSKLIGIVISTKRQAELIDKFDIQRIRQKIYPNRSAELLTMIAEHVGETYNWEEDKDDNAIN